MKSAKATYFCIDRKCDWQFTNHTLHDGVKCPKCNLPANYIVAKRVPKDYKEACHMTVDMRSIYWICKEAKRKGTDLDIDRILKITNYYEVY